MNLKMTLEKKRTLKFQKLKNSNRSMTRQWTSLLKVKLTLKERKLLKTRDFNSKSRESENIMIRCNNQLRGTKKDSSKRRRKLKKCLLRELLEYSKKRKVLRLSTNKRERLLRNLRRTSNKLPHKMKEKELYKLKSTKVLKKDNMISLLDLKLKIRNSRSKMIN